MSADVSEIMSAVKNRIEQIGILKEVRVVENQIIFGRLLDTVPDLTGYPAALVCGGETLMKNGGVTCEVIIDVIVIDQFFDILGKTDESKMIMIKTRDLFAPALNGQLFSINEYHFMIRGVENIKLNPEHIAWNIKLTVFTSC